MRRLYLLVGAVLLFFVIFGPLIMPVLAQAPEVDVKQESTEDVLLRRELGVIGEEIAALRATLRELRGVLGTIDGEIVAIQAEIARTELSIRRSEVATEQLTREITRIEGQIVIYEEDVAAYQQTLAELIRSVAERDDILPLAVLFSGGTLSDIANQIEEASAVQEQILGGIQALRGASAKLLDEEERLDGQRMNEEQVLVFLLIEKEDLLIKQELEKRLSDAATEATETMRGELSVSELDAAKIRRQLYPVGNSGDGLTFEEAYLLVKPVAELVGVRPAFILAILQKETHFGELKGSGQWRIDMHPRDWEAFIEITSELGLNPDDVPVSRKPSYGWGGAMGPAQFIPSTWLGYRKQVSEVTGNIPPSPWNLEDAFAASAIKLAAGGATAQNEEAEWKAAMLYFAGGNWNNPAYAFYGDTVEDLTSRYQAMIQILEENIVVSEEEVEVES